MIKLRKTQCPHCQRTVHAVLSHGEWRGECSVCSDGFTMPTVLPEVSEDERRRVDEFFDNLSFDDLKVKLGEAGYAEDAKG